MSRQLKVLGLVALAMLAVSVNAATASAKIAEFASEKYPAAIASEQVTAPTFTINAGKIKCTTVKFVGNLAAQAKKLVVTPTYEKCTVLGFAGTVETNGCTYELETGFLEAGEKSMGLMSIACPAGKKIVIKAPALGCEISIGPEAGLGFVDYANEGLVLKTTFSVETDYTLNNKCGPAAGLYEGGMLASVHKLKGNNGQLGIL